MRVCPKCNKSNLPTRKYCIRCAASLIVPPKKRAAVDEAPKPEVPEIGRVTTAASMARQAAESAAPPPTTDDQWVKPSEVSRDRVRTASGGARKTELEKAQEAFARAEDVGIDEDGTGIIETRMLRASEVRELLESASTHATPEVPAPMMMEGSEPLTPEEMELMQPTMPQPQALEEQILGTKSAFVAPDEEVTPQPEKQLDTDVSAGFSSARYEEADEEPGIRMPDTLPTVTAETLAPQPTPTATPQPIPTTVPQPSTSEETITPVSTVKDELDHVTICHNCGEATNIDQFEYPVEVYSAMGAARLKQARFLVVQGKSDRANESLRIARSLYKKAGDETGLNETKRLIDSLARGG